MMCKKGNISELRMITGGAEKVVAHKLKLRIACESLMNDLSIF